MFLFITKRQAVAAAIFLFIMLEIPFVIFVAAQDGNKPVILEGEFGTVNNSQSLTDTLKGITIENDKIHFYDKFIIMDEIILAPNTGDFDTLENIKKTDSQREYDTISEYKDSRIDINHADLEKLISLPGIGPVLGQRIIDYREKNGYFKKIDELKKVKGIGSKKLEKLEKYIKIEL